MSGGEWFIYETRGDVVIRSGWARLSRPLRRVLVPGSYDVRLREYFRGAPVSFRTVPVDLSPLTALQQAVLVRVRRIVRGRTVSYSVLAGLVGRPRAARAIGQALGSNPAPVFIPCHRVVAASGVGGFSSGLARKRHLLELERRQ